MTVPLRGRSYINWLRAETSEHFEAFAAALVQIPSQEFIQCWPTDPVNYSRSYMTGKDHIFCLLLHVNSPKSASLETEKLPVSSLWVRVLWSSQHTLWVGLRVAIVYPVGWRNRTSWLRIYLLAISDDWLIAAKIITHKHWQCWGAYITTADPKLLCLMQQR